MQGFLGTDAPFMMDFVVVSLIAIVPILCFSIYKVKQGATELHRKVQLTLAIVLGIAVVLFEVEMRLAGGIVNIMPPERYTILFRIYLWTHIAIAVSTLVVWTLTLVGANANYVDGAMRKEYRDRHRCLGVSSTLLLLLTSGTGLGVYAWCFF
jgi:hypothetical protein